MHSFIYFLSGAALLQSSFCASSTPSSFSVQQTSTGKFKSRGALSLVQAYKRHGAQFSPEMAAEARAQSSKGKTGSAPALPTEEEEVWASPLTIGGQTLNVQFDTGSSDIWVYSTLTPARFRGDRGKERLYDPARSANATKLAGQHFGLHYGSGDVAGTVYRDVVSIGDVIAPEMAVGVPLNVSSSFYDDDAFDGLLGLGSSGGMSVRPHREESFLASVIDELERPYFAVDLKHRAPGVFTFGKLPEGYEEEDVSWVDTSGSYWGVNINRWAVGNGSLETTDLTPIVDTGSPYLFLSPDHCEKYYKDIPSATYDQKHGYVFDCDATLPEVKFEMDGYTAVVPGSVLLSARIDDKTCHSGLQPIAGLGVPPAVFGDIFIKSQLTVFKVDEDKGTSMGFAPKKD